MKRQPSNRTEFGNVTKVLYVEHDDDNLYMLKMRLERGDAFKVIASDNSEQGYKLAATERPDVILMDLEMPDADYWELVRRLKKDAQTGHIPIIGLSAYALDSERETAIATGLTKAVQHFFNQDESVLFNQDESVRQLTLPARNARNGP
jgi:CheY-like chemotaxis protein